MTEYAEKLKPLIMARLPDGNGLAKVVFRPDSGDPLKILVGDPEAGPGTPQYKGAVECLWDIFGGTKTAAGFRQLDPHVGLIYGDSITLYRAHAILKGLKEKGFASTNVVFGIGSYTYQHVTRDTFGIAIKATFGIVDGKDRQISKSPKTDSGVKKSASGLLRVKKEHGNFVLHENQTREQEQSGMLQTVFENSKMIRIDSFDAIRARLIGSAA